MTTATKKKKTKELNVYVTGEEIGIPPPDKTEKTKKAKRVKKTKAVSLESNVDAEVLEISTQHTIEERAYFKWKDAGCPTDDESRTRFWAEAEKEYYDNV